MKTTSSYVPNFGQDELASKNTDVEIWRKEPDNYYSPAIHKTIDGAIGINVGGSVIVMSVEDWHKAAKIRKLVKELLVTVNDKESI